MTPYTCNFQVVAKVSGTSGQILLQLLPLTLVLELPSTP